MANAQHSIAHPQPAAYYLVLFPVIALHQYTSTPSLSFLLLHLHLLLLLLLLHL